MPIRKKGDVEIQASANGTKVKQTGYTFYSYDKKSAALYFQFRGQDGQPTDLGKATIHLVMILNDDDGKEFIPKSDEIKVISAIRGTAKFVLPEMLLAYQGKVTGYIYLDFEDGSQTDEGQFTFRIKHSMITHVLPEVGDKYVQDFEDVKERVEQAGDSATKDIEKAKDSAESQIGDYAGEVESAKDSTIEDIDKALPEVVESAKQDISLSASDVQSKANEASEDISNLVKTTEDARDNAESQIGDYVGEVESAKNDISSSASDVQNKASEASEDISGLVKSTEDARDNAESQIGDYVGEVESAKDSAVEDIDKALPEVEGKLQDLQKEMIVGGRNYIRNSNMWASKEKKTFEFLSYAALVPGTYVLSADIEIVNAHPKAGIDNKRLGVEFKVNYESEKDEWLHSFYYPKEGENYKGRIYSIIEIKDTITWTGQKGLFANQIEGDVVRVGLPKLARGNVPTDWSPAIEDYDAKIKRLENAITNLGGSI